MTRKTRFSFGLLAFVALFVGLFLGLSSAQAQNACAANDLPCRVAALETRLATLEGRQARTEVQAEAIQRAQPNYLNVSRRCATNCQPEAQDVCVSRGFVSGTAEEWTRDRSGALMLTRATCRRE